MNILPKKRWHVRTKENIARVRRDEAEAAEIEKEKERRAKLAEQEARTAFLREQARNANPSLVASLEEQTHSDAKAKVEADIYTSSGNINFFKDVEAGLKISGTNKEHEDEKKNEKEEYERKIGLLKYLGQDTLESTGKVAWYEDRNSSSSLIHTVSRGPDKEENEEVGLKIKSAIDPLKEIMKHTGTKIYPKEISPIPTSHSDSIAACSEVHRNRNLCRKDKRHKKKKKHDREDGVSGKKRKISGSSKKLSKHKKRRYNRSKASSSSNEDSSTSDSASDPGVEGEKQAKLAKLREERLKREAFERKREERLLAGKNPDEEDKKPTAALPFQQKYNSQFNPHLAKQNQINMGLQAGVKYWLQ